MTGRLCVLAVEPIGGHGAMFLYDLAFFRALAKAPIDIVWITCDETNTAPEGYELWKPFVGIYGRAPAWRRAMRYAAGLLAVLRRARAERKHRPVVIHQQFVTLASVELPFVLCARALGIPCILSPHDVHPYRRSTRRLLRWVYGRYDALIVHSRTAETQLAEMLEGRGATIRRIAHGHYNDSHASGPTLEPSVARRRLDLPEAAPVMLFLGLVKPEKGVEYLIRAMPAVLQQCPDAVLLIGGRPWRTVATDYEALIDALGVRASIRTRWEYVSDDELPLYYRAADVVVLPYTKVFQSGVCLTAYAFRRPVVASRVGGLEEQVEDGVTGRLVPPRDAGALAAALVDVLRDRAHAQRMGEAGRRWAQDACDWDRIGRETAAVYAEVWQRHQ